MEDDPPNEPRFRANKRRKVFRKRANLEGETAGDAAVSNSAAPAIREDESEGDDNDVSGIVRSQKKTGAKKQGIAFTSSGVVRSTAEEREEKALVVGADEQAPALIQGDRFVKPTGRIVVTENKHMVAYIDSKLAEMRSTTDPPLNGGNTQDSASVVFSQQNSVNQGEQRDAISAVRTTTAPTTFDQAQSRSASVYHRPTKRKQPPKREQTDAARDSIIDQIMQESQVPLYDRSGSHTPAEDADNDAATAQAFKAQLLVEMEQQNRRRPPAHNPATKGATGSMQSGPKLGGSRRQREKMRALEEAKTKPSTGKK